MGAGLPWGPLRSCGWPVAGRVIRGRVLIVSVTLSHLSRMSEDTCTCTCACACACTFLLLTYLLVISLTWHTTIASTLPRRSAPLS